MLRVACRLSLVAAVASSRPTSALDSLKPRVYTTDEVSRHNGKDSPLIYVSFQGRVFDITQFVRVHPGGSEYILEAAGGPIEPFWGYWAYHFSVLQPTIFLKRYEIGILAHSVVDDLSQIIKDCYSDEPERNHSHVTLTDQPYTSETRLEVLVKNYLTRQEDLYIRHHAPVPNLNALNLNLRYADQTFTITQDDLRGSYPTATILSVLQCAGNRAKEMLAIAPTAFKDTPFQEIGSGMIGNVQWTGVRLRDVLLDKFPDLSEESNLHIWFEGVDGYVTSIPLSRALDPCADVLLAWEMNAETLTSDHGFPLRVVVPGVAGARSVKWLTRISIHNTEADSCWQKVYYMDPVTNAAILSMPIQSIVLQVENGVARGIAWGGGEGSPVTMVQVSTDQETWVEAELQSATLKHYMCDSSMYWGWVSWTCKVPPGKNVTCRAFNLAGDSQPRAPWNSKGYSYNGWSSLR